MTGLGRDHLLAMAEGVRRKADTLTGKRLKIVTDQGVQTTVFSNPNSLTPVECVRISTRGGVVECTADTWVEMSEFTWEASGWRNYSAMRQNTIKAGRLFSTRHMLIERFLAVPVLLSCQSFISLTMGPVRVLFPPV